MFPIKRAPEVIDPKAEDDDLSLRSCATEFFRWVRAGADVISETPAFVQRVSNDLVQAWHDSAKR
jgi:hypothetical protein